MIMSTELCNGITVSGTCYNSVSYFTTRELGLQYFDNKAAER